MSIEYKLSGHDSALGPGGHKRRVQREFSIMMRPIKTDSTSSFDPEPASATAAPATKQKWSKLSRKTSATQAKQDTMLDVLTEFTQRKSKHWALVIHKNKATPGGKEFRSRLLEIRDAPPAGSIPDGTAYGSESWSALPESRSEHELDDNAKEHPEPTALGSTMRMQVNSSVAAGFVEPDYSQGGVLWDLLDRLKSETKSTNTEIQREAQRIWNRQKNYRVFSNNNHRFCILLAIHLRAKQESTLRILTGDILKAQKTEEGPLSTPAGDPIPKKK